jgi:hypothetical protein
MLELAALAAVLVTLANMASDRRLNVKIWVGIALAGWVALAVMFRFLLPSGWMFSLFFPWAFFFGIVAFVWQRKIPVRIRTFEGLEELTKSMEEARAHRERAE